MNYFNEKIEKLSLDEMMSLQSKRLIETVKHVYKNVPFYKKKMDSIGIKPEDIKSIEDIEKLPFTEKDDLRDNYPYGLLAKPLSECIRIQSTSGTTGKRVIAFYTKNDIEVWDECCARALVAAGATKDDVVHVSYGYGLFTGGPGLNGGSHMLGSLTVPMSSGNTERQLQFMCDLGSTILCSTPSYAEFLAEEIKKAGLKDKIKLKAGIFGAEAWSEEMRKDIEKNLGIKAYDIYGLTEITGPGVSFECEGQTGMHINEDHFYPEIIDPKTLNRLGLKEKGELVFTSITKEAFPLLRYRTRDICILDREECSCKRTLIKMRKPMGRSDDMLIIRGVNVFPSQIETVLLKEGYSPNYQIILDRVNFTDTFLVKVEMNENLFSDELSVIEEKERELLNSMRAMLGISPKIKLVNQGEIPRSEGKAVRVIDNRKI